MSLWQDIVDWSSPSKVVLDKLGGNKLLDKWGMGDEFQDRWAIRDALETGDMSASPFAAVQKGAEAGEDLVRDQKVEGFVPAGEQTTHLWNKYEWAQGPASSLAGYLWGPWGVAGTALLTYESGGDSEDWSRNLSSSIGGALAGYDWGGSSSAGSSSSGVTSDESIANMAVENNDAAEGAGLLDNVDWNYAIKWASSFLGGSGDSGQSTQPVRTSGGTRVPAPTNSTAPIEGHSALADVKLNDLPEKMDYEHFLKNLFDSEG